MRYKLPLSIALLCTITVSFANNAAEHLAAQLRYIKTYQAHFTQKTYDGQHLVGTTKGLMALKRPGYFRWETFSPTHQIILVTQKTMQTYDVDLAQVTTQKLTAQQQAAPAALLSGSVKSIEKDFLVKQQGGQFTLVPKQPGGFKNLSFSFKNHVLVKMQLLNSLGQRNIYQFNQIKQNRVLSNSVFRLKLPKGVTKI